jgi:hypothetical protein
MGLHLSLEAQYTHTVETVFIKVEVKIKKIKNVCANIVSIKFAMVLQCINQKNK